MGEAKKRRNALTARLLQEAERLSMPPSVDESALVAELDTLDVVRVFRQPRARLERARMRTRMSHDNARWFEKNDPDNKARAVIGWRLSPGGLYILHSIVETGDVLTCVTPSGIDGDAEWFDFVRDPDIEVLPTGDRYRFVRKGVELGYGARRDPQKVIAAMAGVKRDLEAGMNPEAILRGLALQFG
jgi:hypothetical protein